MGAKSGTMMERLSAWLGLAAPPAQPDDELGVTWMLLPPYDIPDMAVISGLLVENQGNEDAQAVDISVSYPGERAITHMEVVSDDPYEMGESDRKESHIKIRLHRMRAGSKVVVYVAGHSTQVPDVIVAVRPTVR